MNEFESKPHQPSTPHAYRPDASVDERGDRVLHVVNDHDRIIVLEERIRGIELATALQAKEYERRLQDLNHAHDKQVQDQQTYISEDKFNGYQSKIDGWRTTVDAFMAKNEGRSGGMSSAQALLFQILALAIGLLGIAAAVFWNKST
jgi:hypothetical protein